VNNLMKIRKMKNMTREELCVKADVKYLTLRAYEQGLREPKVGPALRIAKALGVSIEELG